MKLAFLIKSDLTRKRLTQAFSNTTCEIYECENKVELFRRCRHSRIDAVLLEQQGEAMKACIQSLQLQFGDSISVVVLGERAADAIVDALAAGAADYANVHDLPEEIASRVMASLSRGKRSRPQSLQVGHCVLSSANSTLRLGERVVRLTPREFAVAWLLFEKAGSIVSTSTIAAAVWGRDAEVTKRTIEQHVHKLRRKLSKEDSFYLRISTRYGIGYSLHPPHVDTVRPTTGDADSVSRNSTL